MSATAVVCLTVAILGGYVQPAGAATLYVNAGGDLQAALNAAQPGDEIVLEAGATFVGAFVLPKRAPGSVITIRSSAVLPERRVTPGDAALMPTLRSGSTAAALTGIGTASWRIVGIRFEPTVNGQDNLIGLQDAEQIELDRILFVAPESVGQRRAVLGNGRHITLRRSHLAGIWAQTLQDSQAFCAWDGAGPYTIVDNYLEAASENVMFGGAPSQSADRIPSDIRIEGNHFSKRLEWKGKARAAKNLLELKSARRVVVRDNFFERNWTDAQGGTAIVFTPRNDSGAWSVVEDVLFEQNVVRDTEGLIAIIGYDGYGTSGRATRITIRQNLLIGSGTFLTVGGEAGEVVVDHNTIEQGYNFTTLYYGDVWPGGTSRARPGRFAVESLTITNNLGYHREYGAWTEAGIGTQGLAGITQGYVWTHNVLAGGPSAYRYPDVTWRPTEAEHRAQFNPDYTLISNSTYRGKGTDGQDLGARWSGANASSRVLAAPANLRIMR